MVLVLAKENVLPAVFPPPDPHPFQDTPARARRVCWCLRCVGGA